MSLYVDFEKLEENIGELKSWQSGFNELNTSINGKVDELNNLWQGEDYEAMRNNIHSELEKITGPEGLIQKFVKDQISTIEEKKGNYAAIQNNNANLWS